MGKVSETEAWNIMLNSTVAVTGTLDPNPWIPVFEGAPYRLAFVFAFPALFFVTAITAFYTSIQSIKQIETPFSVYRIVHHKGGRTSVTIILCVVECVSSIIIGVVTHKACYQCSSCSANSNTMLSLFLGLPFISLSTTCLAGAFWFDRRDNLERRASFAQVDERPFLEKYMRPVVIVFLLFVACDVAFMSFFFTSPHYQILLSGIGAILSYAISITFIVQTLKFKKLIVGIRANASDTFKLSKPFQKMERVTTWFALSSTSIFLFATVVLMMGIMGIRLDTTIVWSVLWGLFVFLRWFMSFSQVMMVLPDAIVKVGHVYAVRPTDVRTADPSSAAVQQSSVRSSVNETTTTEMGD